MVVIIDEIFVKPKGFDVTKYLRKQAKHLKKKGDTL